MTDAVVDGYENLRRRQAEMKVMIANINNGRKPEFGDALLNPWAGERNPHRIGYYISQFRRSGRCNPGHFYKLTDKKGHLWDSWSHNLVFVDHLKGDEVWP